MKRCVSFLILLALLALGMGAAAEAANEFDLAAQSAREALIAKWRELYADDMYEGHSGYLEIKNTRVIRICDKPVSNVNEGCDESAAKFFGDASYVVEFMIYTDYMLTEPYYGWDGMYDSAVIHRNGSVTVDRNPFLLYRARTYSADYTGIIEQIEDLGAAYNDVYRLR